MLELRNISRIYKQKKGPQVAALDQVSLTFNKKGMVFILGKSGSGKSTLLNVIGGLDKYTSGDLLIKGKSTKTFTQSEFDSYRNTMIGFIFQEYNVLDDFTVGQNIGIALELQGKKADSATINEYLDLLDMLGYATRKPNTLSGGQKQRVAIARALVKNPEIIMADEPTGALDSATGRQLFESLKKLSEDKLIIVVTHDHEFAETYGDRIIEFSDGKVIRDITKDNTAIKKEKVINENGITVSAGYVLTEEDLKEINAYLKGRETKTTISVSSSDYKFNPTTQPEPFPQAAKLPLIKSRLPFLSALKIGASALKHKTFRLALSILLASTAFAMFGLTDTMASFNQHNTTLNTMIDVKVETSSIKKIQRTKTEFDNYYFENDLRLTDQDITSLNAIHEDVAIFPMLKNETFGYTNHVGDAEAMSNDPYFGYVTESGFTHLTTADLTKANLRLRAGRLPEEIDEIVIPQYVFDMFKKFDFRTNSLSDRVKINSYQDIIDKTMTTFTTSYTIVGVMDTNLDYTPFQKLADARQDPTINTFMVHLQYQEYLKSSFHQTIFVHENFFADKATQIVEYINPSGTYFYFDYLDGGEFRDYQYINSFYPTSNLDKMKTAIFFDESTTAETMTTHEYVINASLLKFEVPALDSIVRTGIAAVTDDLVATTANDEAIEAFLKQFYDSFDFASPDDVKPYTTWTALEQTEYRYAYADVLLTPYMFYETNPFQPLITGKTLLINKIKGPIASSLDPITFELVKEDGNGPQKYSNSKIVGVDFDFGNFLYVTDAYQVTPRLYISSDTASLFGLSLNGIYPTAIVYHGQNKDIMKKIVSLNYDGTGNQTGEFFRINNQVLAIVNTVGSYLEMFSQIFTIIGTIFAIFAALLLVNFITLSVAFKKQEIGILRAIGARGVDVSTIFMNEAGIIALINYVIALTATIIISGVINNYFKTQFGIDLIILIVGIRQILLILVIAVGIAALSSFIPVFRLTLKKPIDAIKGR